MTIWIAGLLMTVSAVLARNAKADDPSLTIPTTSINASPLGVLGLTFRNVGSFAINVVQRLGPQHAALLEINGIHVHAKQLYTHLWTFGATTGWRYHLKPTFDTPFVGLNFWLQVGIRQVFS
ncbi:MAG: hypothetical protein EXR77_12850 [Myxococcales bacterium]|nr:hypothetical protein [Myxococcales bacterium]